MRELMDQKAVGTFQWPRIIEPYSRKVKKNFKVGENGGSPSGYCDKALFRFSQPGIMCVTIRSANSAFTTLQIFGNIKVINQLSTQSRRRRDSTT